MPGCVPGISRRHTCCTQSLFSAALPVKHVILLPVTLLPVTLLPVTLLPVPHATLLPVTLLPVELQLQSHRAHAEPCACILPVKHAHCASRAASWPSCDFLDNYIPA